MTETKRYNLKFLKKWMKAKFVEVRKLKYLLLAGGKHTSQKTRLGASVCAIMIILN